MVLPWLSFGGGRFVWFGCGVCWSNALALAAHVSELSLLGFGKMIVNVFDVDKQPGEELSGPNGL